MVKLLAWLHGLLLRGCWWALKMPFKALLALLLSILALLGEEVRRWVGVAMAGLLIVVAGKAVMGYAPASVRTPVVLAILAMLALWALSVRRAAWLTRQNNLIRVRQRQAFRQLSGEVGQIGGRLEGLRGEVVEGVARRAKGTRFEGAFFSNREDRARQAAADQAARERAEAEARQVARRAVEAERAEQQRQAEAERVAAAQAARLPANVLTATRRARQRRRAP